ncbi:WXG100 family type VII secretion target [Micromonospora okii]|uniref:WXG100 family type VII secretion target n=1 Tax=Micromonospora okii TaxID=1182970 RepID=UPI001E3BBB47|nr:WXG100 family type VII secretion target [Micromonospora okii]
MGDKSWEEMAREVLVEGRPADVQSAALGWKELIKNVGQVQDSLEKNVKDIGAVWKGPAYEAFKTHVEGLAKNANALVEAVDDPGRGKVSIVATLEAAARQLEEAQAKMPIPASCVGDVLAARNGEITLGVGLFETRVKADLLGSWPVEQIGKLGDWVTGWFSDQEGDARKVYNEVNGNFKDRTMEAPSASPLTSLEPGPQEVPNLGGGPGAGPTGKVPSVGGPPKMPGTGLPDGPTPGIGDPPKLDGVKPDIPPSTHPDLSTRPPGTGTGNIPDTGYPGVGRPDTDYGTGLAGAGPAPATSGLGSGGGLGGGAGLSGGGAGGGIPGGGALGKAVSPGLPPMLGGGGAGAGGRGAGGRLGGGKAGMGGMMGPGMGGGAGGRGAGGKAAAGGAGRPGGAVAGRGGVGMGGHGGAGYAEEEQVRNTWLEEDEDVWGAGGDGAPGILR